MCDSSRSVNEPSLVQGRQISKVKLLQHFWSQGNLVPQNSLNFRLMIGQFAPDFFANQTYIFHIVNITLFFWGEWSPLIRSPTIGFFEISEKRQQLSFFLEGKHLGGIQKKTTLTVRPFFFAAKLFLFSCLGKNPWTLQSEGLNLYSAGVGF